MPRLLPCPTTSSGCSSAAAQRTTSATWLPLVATKLPVIMPPLRPSSSFAEPRMDIDPAAADQPGAPGQLAEGLQRALNQRVRPAPVEHPPSGQSGCGGLDIGP